MRRLFASLLLFSLLVPASVVLAQAPPNIVLIIGDDHGWNHASFLGHPYALTPNIDALAAAGTVFTNAHNTASTCWPSLRTYLTGLHSRQWDNRRTALYQIHGPIDHRREAAYYRTLPRELGRRGYVSFQGGKMWDGTYEDAGFTSGLAITVGSGTALSPGWEFGREGIDSFRDFLDTTDDAPFFAWLAPMLPHAPFDADPVFRAPFNDLGLRNFEVNYLANLLWLDEVVGKIVAELTERGLLENTLIIYASDNGWQFDTWGFGQSSQHGKASIYEQGIRTPLIFAQPGVVPSGVLRDDLVSIEDLFPTLLDYGTAAPVPGRWGESLREGLEQGTPVGRNQLSARVGLPQEHGYFVRTPDWRYISTSDGREELYAIQTDPMETSDLSSEHPELVAEFRSTIEKTAERYETPSEFVDASGRLLDAQGGALEGIPLVLKGRTADRQRIRILSLSGAGGYFRFANLPHGDYRLSARGGAVHDLEYSGQSGRRISFTLPVAQTGAYLPILTSRRRPSPSAGSVVLRGTVRDEAGAPVEAHTVRAYGRAGFREETRTAEDGSFRFEYLPTTRVRVRTPRTGQFQATSTRLTPTGSLFDTLQIVARSR